MSSATNLSDTLTGNSRSQIYADTPAVTPEISETLDRLRTATVGGERATAGNGGENQAGDSGKSEAAELIRSIGHDFVILRQQGRSAAWAELEDRLMKSAHVLISAGMMSAKDWIGIARDIEEFRKSEGGNQTLPADFIAQWLSEPEPKANPVVHVKSIKEKKPRAKKKAKKV